MKSKIGPVTAYADAVQAGYTGTREEFGRQQADFAKNAASVEQAKTEVNQAIESFGQTANVAKQDVISEGDRQVQRIEDIVLDLSLDREQIASNTAGVEEAKAAAEEAKTIAKGRATGYVFDTAEDMETWLASEENTQKLVLGDNLYIRATDVPDYWWDGTQAQPLETQKVDMQEYVKFTDYASNNDYGVVKAPNKYGGGIEIENGNLKLYMADNNVIYNKQPVTIRRAIGAGHMDLISVQSAHQEMSNDYDPSTALTPDGGVPYAYGDRQPVSYAAVKGYVDSKCSFHTNTNPDFETVLEEDIAFFSVDEINGEQMDFNAVHIEIDIPVGTTDRAYVVNNANGFAYVGFVSRGNKDRHITKYIDIYKRHYGYVIEYNDDYNAFGVTGGLVRNRWIDVNTITKITISASGGLASGTGIKIWRMNV